MTKYECPKCSYRFKRFYELSISATQDVNCCPKCIADEYRTEFQIIEEDEK